MKNILLLALCFAWGCCKPPVNMDTITLHNTYIGLDSVYARMANGDSITVVCYGNSITHGAGTTYPATFQQLLRQEYGNANIRVVNEGHGGWTAEMASAGLDTLVLPYRPDLVAIKFGINDLYQEKGLVNYGAHLAQMIQTLKQRQIPVLVMSPTPLYNRKNKQLLDFCAKAAEVARQENVAFFHLHAAMVDRIYAETDNPATLLPDEVHYTDQGYAMIGEELMKYWR